MILENALVSRDMIIDFHVSIIIQIEFPDDQIVSVGGDLSPGVALTYIMACQLGGQLLRISFEQTWSLPDLKTITATPNGVSSR